MAASLSASQVAQDFSTTLDPSRVSYDPKSPSKQASLSNRDSQKTPGNEYAELQNILCMVCQRLPMINLSAFECSSCKRMICDGCIKKINQDHKGKDTIQCRNCKVINPEFTNNITEDKRKILIDIKVQCSYCNYTGFPHINFYNHEKSCFHQCAICNQRIPKSEKDQHALEHQKKFVNNDLTAINQKPAINQQNNQTQQVNQKSQNKSSQQSTSNQENVPVKVAKHQYNKANVKYNRAKTHAVNRQGKALEDEYDDEQEETKGEFNLQNHAIDEEFESENIESEQAEQSDDETPEEMVILQKSFGYIKNELHFQQQQEKDQSKKINQLLSDTSSLKIKTYILQFLIFALVMLMVFNYASKFQQFNEFVNNIKHQAKFS